MSHQTHKYEIRFEGLSAAQAGIKAAKLRRELLDVSPEVSVSLAKDDPTSQDFGATLILVLGTPAILAVANGIASYIARDRAKIVISENGKVVAEGVSGDDAARIAEAFSKHVES